VQNQGVSKQLHRQSSYTLNVLDGITKCYRINTAFKKFGFARKVEFFQKHYQDILTCGFKSGCLLETFIVAMKTT
jgi:hypothetical protein